MEETELGICRACVCECVEYKSLYKQGLIMGEVTTLATLLNYCTGLDFLPEEETLPGSICMRCVHQLAKFYAFKKNVLEANDMLRKQHMAICSKYEPDDETDNITMEPTIDVGDEEGVEVIVPHYITEETGVGVVADELQGLAMAAQMRRDMDDMEYVTVTVMQHGSSIIHNDDDDDEEEGIIEDVTDRNDDTEEDMLDLQEITETTEVYPNTAEEFITETDDQSSADCSNIEIISVDRKHSRRHFSTTELEVDEAQFVDEDEDEQNAPIEYYKPRTVRSRVKNAGPKCVNPDLQCKVCGKQLSNAHSYRYHMQLHSDCTPFLCSLCGEGFKTRNAYEGHLVIHDPNNPNTCNLCGKAYRQPSSLRTHMLTHTGEKPFPCDICGKRLTQKSGYKKHMLTHTGEMPFACDLCGRQFRYSSNLLAHKRWHTGDRPFECGICQKSFPTSEQRKRHMLVHSRERPFSCDVCKKTFKRRSSLTSHRQTHELPECNGSGGGGGADDNVCAELIEHKVFRSKVVELY